jgi:hypothetical protein
MLQNIKKRHDPTVTTVAQGVLEWKRKRGAGRIDQSVQEWLDRFYMSRIGIRFLIGQRKWTSFSAVEMGFEARIGSRLMGRCGFEYSTTSFRLCGNHLYKSGTSIAIWASDMEQVLMTERP